MHIQYKTINAMPPLAWIAQIKKTNVIIYSGELVEHQGNFLVAGVWDDEYSKGNFINADWFCGTGGKIIDNSIVFSTPTHVEGSLVLGIINNEDKSIFVSNSIQLLCAFTNCHFDSQYSKYETDFNSILLGINKYTENLRVYDVNNNLVDFKIEYYKNIIVDDDNTIKIIPKNNINNFTCFTDYYNRLTKSVQKMMNNSKDKLRKHCFESVSTISQGYDAPCVATIAHKFGCNTCVTFSPRGKYKYDNGKEIGKIIGYANIIERDFELYKNNNILYEAYAIASGELGTDFEFYAFSDIFKGKIVFNGERGDKIWDYKNHNCNDCFCFDDFVSGIGNVETSLWIGYVPIPLPQYGAKAWPSILKISQSVEMKHWNLSNDYNRPIPRRIVEEVGVDRKMFGQKKRGAGIILRYDWYSRIKKKMSPTSFKSFSQFVKKNYKLNVFRTVKYFYLQREAYLSRVGIKINTNMSKAKKAMIANQTSVRYLFPWASNVVQNEYKRILKGVEEL